MLLLLSRLRRLYANDHTDCNVVTYEVLSKFSDAEQGAVLQFACPLAHHLSLSEVRAVRSVLKGLDSTTHLEVTEHQLRCSRQRSDMAEQLSHARDASKSSSAPCSDDIFMSSMPDWQ